MSDIPAHDQHITESYIVHYPPHPPRESDPHYIDFNDYHERTKATAVCSFGAEVGDFSECDLTVPLELHHSHIEFALQNAVDLTLLDKVYPGIANPDELGAWVESAANLIWLCQKHHRAAGIGIHHASSSDYEASHFIRNLISSVGHPATPAVEPQD